MCETNLYDEIKTTCIKQLAEAIEGKGLYKARYAKALDIKDYGSAEKYAKAHVEALIVPDEFGNNHDFNDIFRRLLISGQNRRSMPNVINFMGREDEFRKILCGDKKRGFDYKEVVKKYIIPEVSEENYLTAIQPYFETNKDIKSKKDEAVQRLYGEFKQKFPKQKNQKTTDTLSQEKEHSKNLWYQYAKFIIDAALFMVKVSENTTKQLSIENFKNRLKTLTQNAKYDFVQDYIAKEISGIRFALACDFLKEIGYDMAKPDRHIKEFLKKRSGKDYINDKKAFCKFQEIADTEYKKYKKNHSQDKNKIEEEHKQYALDKLIWLCCSGNYYEKKTPDNTIFEEIIVNPKSLREMFLDNLKFPS